MGFLKTYQTPGNFEIDRFSDLEKIDPGVRKEGGVDCIANWYLNQGKNVRTWVAADAKTPEYKALENKETYVGYLQNQYDVVGRRLIFNQVAKHLCSMYYPDEFDG